MPTILFLVTPTDLWPLGPEKWKTQAWTSDSGLDLVAPRFQSFTFNNYTNHRSRKRTSLSPLLPLKQKNPTQPTLFLNGNEAREWIMRLYKEREIFPAKMLALEQSCRRRAFRRWDLFGFPPTKETFKIFKFRKQYSSFSLFSLRYWIHHKIVK